MRTALDEDAATGAMVAVSVEDRGTGIPAELRDKVFEPFFSTKPEGEGTGLGLWIVWETARRHRGRVRIEALEPGTRLSLLLPVADGTEETVDG